MTDRTALVTGASGFIGSRLCEGLLDAGYDVRATDLETADTTPIPDDVPFRPADLTTREDLDDAVQGVDVVFHTAALFSYSSLIDWEAFEAVNVDGTEHLCEAMLDEGVDRLVLWSTCGVYGDTVDDQLPVTEDHPKNPGSDYDRSKWLQEQTAMRYHDEEGLDVRALRCASVYGPGNTYGAAQMVLGIASGAIRNYPLFCDRRAGLVHVEDVLRAAIHLDEHGAPGEAYNVSDDCEYAMNRVIKEIAARTGQHVYGLPIGCETLEHLTATRPLVAAAERLFDAVDREPPIEAGALNYLKGNYWISNDKLRATGWEPAYPSFRDGIEETLDWYRGEGMI